MQEIGSRLRFLFPQNVRPSQRFLMRCRCRCHCLRSIQSLDQRLPLRLRIQYFVFSFVGIHLTKNETCILFIIYGSHQQNHPLKAQNQQRKKTIYVLIFYCFEILNPDFDNSIPLLYIFFFWVFHLWVPSSTFQTILFAAQTFPCGLLSA